MNKLWEKAMQIREDLVTLIYKSGGGHIGGDLSETDILVTLYYKYLHCSPSLLNNPNRDRFILSKGHSVETLYCILADLGYFPKSDLDNYSGFNSKYIGHPNNNVNGIEMNTGSLGHGLSLGVGMALAGKMDKKDYRVYVVMGDGESAEGSVWEAAMAASHYKLDNLTLFVDRNHLQISGDTENVMAQDSLQERWSAFGWNTITINGNKIGEISRAIETAQKNSDKPTVIIANTTKGSGCPSIENKAEWHHKLPTLAEYKILLAEIRAGGENHE
jgi:transketolase